MNKEKVIIGLSGGVDSSIAAYLLKDSYESLESIFMQNWNNITGLIDAECHWEDDFVFAKLVANQLKIKLDKIDLSDEYRKRIVDYMFAEYEAGRTPNPDILCNREIKFDTFLNICLEKGADYIATGHYAGKRYIEETNEFALLSAKDKNKDQSYFLSQLNQEQLSRAIFPLSDITKPEVRELAKKLNLVNQNKKDSQGLCFIGKIDLPTFLKQKLIPRVGEVIEISNDIGNQILNEVDFNDLNEIVKPYQFEPSFGKVIGEHSGVQFYTIGQRKGLNLGGFPNPLYVLHIDNDKNKIYVGQGENHHLLHRKGLKILNNEIHWIRPSQKLKIEEEKDFFVRFRHRQELQKAKLIQKSDDLYVIFDKLQKGISPGQFISWYLDDECFGSGVIN